MKSILRRYVGDRAFYKTVLLLVVPIIIQNGVTNFVNLLDNVMVGALGTEQMSGVSISNQLIFIYNLTIFGGMSGASIFGAQFFGVRDYAGMRSTMRFKILFGALISAAAVLILSLFGDRLVLLFLDNQANAGTDISGTLRAAGSYVRCMLWGLPAFMLVSVYAGTLRESGETVVPMAASLSAIAVNLVGNWLLIFGHFGLPALGVVGAALATVLSRYVELAIVVIYSHTHAARFPYVRGLYRGITVPRELVRRICVTGAPLLVNELLWSMGTAFVSRNFSTRGLAVVAAININNTAWGLFSVMMMSMGSAVAILIGQKLGAGEIDAAKDADRKILAFTTVLHIVVGAIVVACSGLFPLLYNTEPEVRALAKSFLIVSGAALPIHAFIHAAYFTIRAGGKTFVTLLFDSVYTWVVPVPLSLLLCSLTSLDITPIFMIVTFSDAVKLIISVPMLRSGFWAKNVIEGVKSE